MYLTKNHRNQIIADYEHLKDWLEENFNVVVAEGINETDGIDPKSFVISINSRKSYLYRLHNLLHEAGHANLYKKNLYPKLFPLLDPYEEDQKWYRPARVEKLKEEFLAWEEGINIALQSGINLDLKLYYKTARSSLYTYILWVVNPKDWD